MAEQSLESEFWFGMVGCTVSLGDVISVLSEHTEPDSGLTVPFSSLFQHWFQTEAKLLEVCFIKGWITRKYQIPALLQF